MKISLDQQSQILRNLSYCMSKLGTTKTCLVIFCVPVCDVINFEIWLRSLIESFPYITKKVWTRLFIEANNTNLYGRWSPPLKSIYSEKQNSWYSFYWLCALKLRFIWLQLLNSIKVRVFFKKKKKKKKKKFEKKNTCALKLRIIIQLDKRRELFSPNTGNFLAIFLALFKQFCLKLSFFLKLLAECNS